MNKNFTRLTTAQFAKLHNVNKRTLHYYDEIGLFSPRVKGENKYRYYDTSQSMDFEYILMLKELNMSIAEIKAYVDNPNPGDFISLADKKSDEIEQQILKLKQTRKLLQAKKEQIQISERQGDRDIQIVECGQENFLTTPFRFQEDDLQELFFCIKNTWGFEQYRAGVGSYISMEKVKNHNFDTYDGLFTPVLESGCRQDIFIKPAGRYLQGYIRGTWDKIPEMYEKMLDYADVHNLELTGYAYERGMNDFAIKDENSYMTQIMINIL